MPRTRNAWNEEIEEKPEDQEDPYWVPPKARKDTDDDPDANALLDPDSGEESDDLGEEE